MLLIQQMKKMVLRKTKKRKVLSKVTPMCVVAKPCNAQPFSLSISYAPVPFNHVLSFSAVVWCCHQALWMFKFSQVGHHTQILSFLGQYQEIFVPCFLNILFHYKELRNGVELTCCHCFQIAHLSVLTLRTHGSYMSSNDLEY